VVASDPSAAQIANAARADGVHYLAMTAECVGIAKETVDVVTVAQALHWFSHEPFYREVDRVLRPNGLLAVWSYALATVAPDVDAIISRFHGETVGPYWPPERALVDSGYVGIDLPYPELETPRFEMAADWNLAQFGGYLSTWSAVGRYRADRRDDPIPPIMASLAGVWGEPSTTRRVRWPLTLRVARKGRRDL
jgi:SAM-dependent methyltransferase